MRAEQEIPNFIGGQWVAARRGQWLPCEQPAYGRQIGRVAASDSHDVNEAVVAAKNAFVAWSSSAPLERARILNRIAQGIESHLERLAEAECLDTGKPITVARTVDIPRSARNFEFFAQALESFHGESFFSTTGGLNYTVHRPLGVVGCISPWNLPLYLLSWKIAPALAAGNTVVAKPSEITPLTAHLLTEIVQEAGLPPGVLNIVHGTGSAAGAAVCEHPEVKAISFTGSTATGRAVALAAASGFKKVSLEMGGKNPAIVFEDADFDAAVAGVVVSAFSNQGQICLCNSRVLVHRSIYDHFKHAVVETTRALKIADPLDPQTQLGSLVSGAHRDKVLGYVHLARSLGGQVLCGGEAVALPGELAAGYFVEPTWIEGLKPECAVNNQEIFGPVATLLPFETEDEAVAIANGTPYGLSASVWTRDLERAHRVSHRLDAGMVWINTWMLRDLRTPFGGVKQSGLGREGGRYALEFFSEVKNICMKGTSNQ